MDSMMKEVFRMVPWWMRMLYVVASLGSMAFAACVAYIVWHFVQKVW
jgi:hypothetical protein